MDRAALGIFRIEIVKAPRRGPNVYDIQGLVADHGAGQLAPGDVFLHQNRVSVRPIVPGDFLRGMASFLAHDDDAEGRSLRHRLHDVGRGQDVFAGGRETRDHDAVRQRDAGGRHHELGLGLVHRERRGEHSGMGVGDAQELQQALDAPVLAHRPVQGVEGDFRLQGREIARHVGRDVEARHPVADALQRGGAGGAGREAHRPLGGPAAHQDRDVLHGSLPLAGRARPRRTVSPRARSRAPCRVMLNAA